jgi:hypothetical protein
MVVRVFGVWAAVVVFGVFVWEIPNTTPQITKHGYLRRIFLLATVFFLPLRVRELVRVR